MTGAGAAETATPVEPPTRLRLLTVYERGRRNRRTVDGTLLAVSST